MRRFIRWSLVLLLVGVVCWLGYRQLSAYWKVDPALKYRLAKLQTGEIIAVVNSTGTIQPVLKVQIGSFVSGPIESASADFNSRVKAGQILAKIDPRIYQANVSRDEAALAHRRADVERIKALLQLAKNNEKRAVDLSKTKASYISDAEMDQVVAERKSLEAQLQLGEAQIKEAEANLSLSQANLEYTVIKSPVDGVVIDRQIDPGQTVAASFQTPVLFIVAPDMEKKMFVYASVDEADIGLIRSAKDRNEPVHFTVDAYPDDLFTGKIQQIRLNPTTLQNVVTYTVVVEAPNAELKLLPGMTANLSFQIEKSADVIKIPNAALRFFPQPQQVHVKYRPLLEGESMQRPDSGSTTEPKPSATETATAARARNKRHVWILEGELLAAVEIETGLSDNSFTELVSKNLKSGQELVIGVRPAGPPS
ncbi:MAG: efflux RND transporter periplasmic adaptor subunit [Planctomycetota bacterium]|nr:efflux RND transporter periplasmic adaptor subunit [Planctomycetota bacterium]